MCHQKAGEHGTKTLIEGCTLIKMCSLKDLVKRWTDELTTQKVEEASCAALQQIGSTDPVSVPLTTTSLSKM